MASTNYIVLVHKRGRWHREVIPAATSTDAAHAAATEGVDRVAVVDPAAVELFDVAAELAVTVTPRA